MTIQDTNETFEVNETQTILDGMAALGRKGIPSGCHGGGCGICKIKVLDGEYQSLPMSRKHITPEDEADKIVLACRIRPCSAIVLQVIGVMKKSVLRRGYTLGAPVEIQHS